MNKIKIISLTLLFSAITILSFGQHQKGHKQLDDEKIKAEKVGYITDELDLTVKEAQVFWPLYNEFDAKITELFKEERKLFREMKKNIETLSDDDLISKTDRLIMINKEKSDLEVEYHEKYKEVLPAKKVALLYKAEKEFRKHLMHKYKGPAEG